MPKISIDCDGNESAEKAIFEGITMAYKAMEKSSGLIEVITVNPFTHDKQNFYNFKIVFVEWYRLRSQDVKERFEDVSHISFEELENSENKATLVRDHIILEIIDMITAHKKSLEERVQKMKAILIPLESARQRRFVTQG